eukprot:gene10081-2249_t
MEEDHNVINQCTLQAEQQCACGVSAGVTSFLCCWCGACILVFLWGNKPPQAQASEQSRLQVDHPAEPGTAARRRDGATYRSSSSSRSSSRSRTVVAGAGAGEGAGAIVLVLNCSQTGVLLSRNKPTSRCGGVVAIVIFGMVLIVVISVICVGLVLVIRKDLCSTDC